jgi:antitoxin component YwqK of YwqJK toxin-antitoxin module
MWIRRAAITLALLFVARNSDAQKPFDVVAVFDIEFSGVKLKRGAMDGLNDYLFGKVAAVPMFKVVPRSELKKRLVAQKKTSYEACYDQSCQIEIGKELAAQKTLNTKILKLGDECNISVVLYDLRTAATEAAADASGGCTPSALARAIEAAVGDLARRSGGAPAPATKPAPMGVVDKESCPEPGTRRMGDPPPTGQAVYCVTEEGKMQGTMTTWHTTGKPAMRAEYREGKLEGKQTIYHRDGAVFQEGVNKSGSKTGKWVSYYDDGVKMEEGEYVTGSKSGIWLEYDRDGKKTREATYAGDLKEGKFVEYHPDGAIRNKGQYSADKQEGLWIELRRDGTKEEEKSYKAGRLHGARIEYDSSGRKERVTTYADGKREGPYEEWRNPSDGSPRLELKGAHKDNERHGVFIRYDADGAELDRTAYERGKKHGPSVHWSGKGDKRHKYEEGEHRDDKRHGLWRRFADDGQPMLEETWLAGKKHGPAVYWSKSSKTGKVYKSTEGSFTDDKKSGRWVDFDEAGKITRDERWEAGKRVQ